MKSIRLLIPALAVALCASAQPFPASLFTTALANKAAGFSAAELAAIQFADVNGDGYPDLCFLDGQDIKCALFVKNIAGGSSFATPQVWLAAAAIRTPLTRDASIFETLQYGDVDGDGKADLCVRQESGFFCGLSTGTVFGPLNMKANQFSDPNRWNSDPSWWRTIKLVDVDHDGKMDVCGRASGGIICQLSMGTIFGGWAFWTTEYSDATGWTTGPAYWSTIQFADIDGDGLPDVCGRAGAGMDCSTNHASTSQFLTPHIATNQYSDAFYWNQVPYYRTIHFGDINGDGKADICGRGSLGIYCGLGQTGVNFGPAFNLNQPDFSDFNGWDRAPEYEKVWLIDIDGDGKADICGRGSEGIFCASSTSTATAAAFAPARLWASSFGDNTGFAADVSYWGTVQPVRSTPLITTTGQRMVGFCGRGYAGIWCSVHFF